MNKRLRTLLIALGVLVIIAAVAGVLVWLPTGGANDETETTTTTAGDDTIPLLDKASIGDAPVLALTITNATGHFEIRPRDDGTMAVTDYPDLPPDGTAITALCKDAAGLSALAVVENAEAAEAYGFSSPSAQFTASYVDGTEATVVFGSKTPYDTGYYAQVDGDSHIYIVDTETAEAFQTSGLSLIGKSLIVAPAVASDDTEGTAQLLELRLAGSGRKQRVDIRLDVNGDYPGMTYVSAYVMTAPYVRAIDSDLFSSPSTAMTSLTASGVAAVHPDEATLASYGLTDPASTAAFTSAVVRVSKADSKKMEHEQDREHMILLGNQDENGNYYALVDGIDAVYLLAASQVPWAQWQYIDLTSKLLFLRDIATVSSVTVNENGQTTVMELTHFPDKENVDENLQVTIGGKQHDTADFRKVYQQLIGIRRLGDADPGAAASGTPVLSVTLAFNDGSDPMTVELYPMTASRYLLMTNDGEQSAVSISKTEDFLKVYADYLAG
ncbi:MAG: DUF4340 domain-containing protein, partial [Clostridia bacterium]|nr:DUF4340 domain-containing protein [Clostridia bacterium]